MGQADGPDKDNIVGMIEKVGLKTFGYTLIAAGTAGEFANSFPSSGPVQWFIVHVAPQVPSAYLGVTLMVVGAVMVFVGHCATWMLKDTAIKLRNQSDAIAAMENAVTELKQIRQTLQPLVPS